MCEVSWVFPTPRLGRYLIRTCLDFLIFIFCLCLFWGVVWAHIFVVGLIFFFIAFKNTNNIVKGGKMQFYWNKLLKIIYYIYTKFFILKIWGRGGHCPPGPRIALSLLPLLMRMCTSLPRVTPLTRIASRVVTLERACKDISSTGSGSASFKASVVSSSISGSIMVSKIKTYCVLHLWAGTNLLSQL